MGCLHQTPPLSGGGREIAGARGLDGTKEARPSKHSMTDADELTETVAARTGPAQVQARWGLSTERGMWTRAPIPNQEVISN